MSQRSLEVIDALKQERDALREAGDALVPFVLTDHAESDDPTFSCSASEDSFTPGPCNCDKPKRDAALAAWKALNPRSATK